MKFLILAALFISCENENYPITKCVDGLVNMCTSQGVCVTRYNMGVEQNCKKVKMR